MSDHSSESMPTQPLERPVPESVESEQAPAVPRRGKPRMDVIDLEDPNDPLPPAEREVLRMHFEDAARRDKQREKDNEEEIAGYWELLEQYEVLVDTVGMDAAIVEAIASAKHPDTVTAFWRHFEKRLTDVQQQFLARAAVRLTHAVLETARPQDADRRLAAEENGDVAPKQGVTWRKLWRRLQFWK